MKRLCRIYKSPRRDEMYLYVDRERALADVPAELLERFGEPIEVMTLVLTPTRKLARADVTEVLASIEQRGFYLQLPPAPDSARQTGGDDE